MNENLNRSAQTNTAIDVISELMERNPELMALGFMAEDARTFIASLFVAVAQYRVTDLSFDDVSECFNLAISDYLAKSVDLQRAGSGRTVTPEKILSEGGIWTGQTKE